MHLNQSCCPNWSFQIGYPDTIWWVDRWNDKLEHHGSVVGSNAICTHPSEVISFTKQHLPWRWCLATFDALSNYLRTYLPKEHQFVIVVICRMEVPFWICVYASPFLWSNFNHVLAVSSFTRSKEHEVKSSRMQIYPTLLSSTMFTNLPL